MDPSLGTAYPARVVGATRARGIWYLCCRYPAQEALQMGLVNAVLPHAELDAEVARWCSELVERSPTALALAKSSINADTESIRGIAGLGMQALKLYNGSEESKEGARAFIEKRKPDFREHALRAAAYP